MAILFRFHRAGYEDSMSTVTTIEGMADLLEIINRSFDNTPPINAVEITPYGGIDARNGWDTHIVVAKNYGVIGFTNKQL